MKNRSSLKIGFGLVCLLATGCTSGKPAGKSMVEVSIPALRALVADDSAPESISDFDCVVLNVTGTGIETTQNLGLVSTMVAANTGGTLKVEVPAGASRLFQIVGVKSQSHSCPTEITRSSLTSSVSYPVLSEVGRTTADIFADTALRIKGSYSSQTAVDLRTGQLLSGSPGDGGGDGGGGGPTPTPTPGGSGCAPAFSSQFAGGEGTTGSPYLVSTAAQWNLIGSDAALSSCSYRLTADIDFAGETPTVIGRYTGVPYFTGTMDGDGHKVQNGTIPLFLDTGVWADRGGLFSFISNGTIKNLTVDNFSLNYSSTSNSVRVGVLLSEGGGTIENVKVMNSQIEWQSTVVVVTKLAGGIVGKLTFGSVTGSSVDTVSITMPRNSIVGGLVGQVTGGDVTTSLVNGLTIVGSAAATSDYLYGGLVGSFDGGVLEDCLVKASTITDTGANKPYFSVGAGGAVGVLYETMRRVGVIGLQINVGSTAGGLVGTMVQDANVTDSFAEGTVTVSSSMAGGVVGRIDTYASEAPVVVRTHSMVTITDNGTSERFGFVGEATQTNSISSSYWNLDLGGADGGDATSAGLVGQDTVDMQDSSNFGGWDFGTPSGVWVISPEQAPRLRSLSAWY